MIHDPKTAALVAAIPCPAEALGRRLAAAHARVAELDAAMTCDDLAERNAHGAEILHLYDLTAALEQQLEWVEASSPAGLYVQMLLLGSAADDLAEAVAVADPSAAPRRRFGRLHGLVLDGLERLLPFGAPPLGKAHYAPNNAPWRAVLVKFGG